MTANQDRTRSIASSAFAIFMYWASLYMYVPILPTHARAIGAAMLARLNDPTVKEQPEFHHTLRVVHAGPPASASQARVTHRGE